NALFGVLFSLQCLFFITLTYSLQVLTVTFTFCTYRFNLALGMCNTFCVITVQVCDETLMFSTQLVHGITDARNLHICLFSFFTYPTLIIFSYFFCTVITQELLTNNLTVTNIVLCHRLNIIFNTLCRSTYSLCFIRVHLVNSRLHKAQCMILRQTVALLCIFLTLPVHVRNFSIVNAFSLRLHIGQCCTQRMIKIATIFTVKLCTEFI